METQGLHYHLLANTYLFQVRANVEKAQQKEKQEYAKQNDKGVKVFEHQVGDLVLWQSMKNTGRKGGKLEALWTGPYKYVHYCIQFEVKDKVL